jgi:hypothetical protein
MKSPSDTLTLPERGLTLLPPWPQAIVYADKRLENRGASVAGHIGTWRGLIALTQSKVWDAKDAEDEAEHLVLSDRVTAFETIGSQNDWKRWAGKLVAVAELMDVLSPERCEDDPWHVAGQWGLILGQVWEVEPVPIIGGRGCWFAGQCPQCDALQARDRIDGTCRRCGIRPKAGANDGDGWRHPELKIVRECTL